MLAIGCVIDESWTLEWAPAIGCPCAAASTAPVIETDACDCCSIAAAEIARNDAARLANASAFALAETPAAESVTGIASRNAIDDRWRHRPFVATAETILGRPGDRFCDAPSRPLYD